MAQPSSLLDVAGVGSREPSTLSNSALVLIDIQREYLPDGKVALSGFDDCLAKCVIYLLFNSDTLASKLLARAREAKTPVIHVVHNGPAGSGFYGMAINLPFLSDVLSSHLEIRQVMVESFVIKLHRLKASH
jgi:nicotinamidase-related amidase